MKERPILFSSPMIRAILAGQKSVTRRVVKPQPPCDGRWEPKEHSALPGVWIGYTPDGKLRNDAGDWRCPFGVPGDQLWCRETFAQRLDVDPTEDPEKAREYALYRADGTSLDEPHWHSYPDHWTPSIHMPRWASRITLEITEVRVERLCEISEEDARAEGIEPLPFPGPWWQGYRDFGDGVLRHTQVVGGEPPAWMIEPKPMGDLSHLNRSAVDEFRCLWDTINGKSHPWESKPWVWVITFRRSDA